MERSRGLRSEESRTRAKVEPIVLPNDDSVGRIKRARATLDRDILGKTPRGSPWIRRMELLKEIKKGIFYIVQYPVRWIAQSAVHFLPSLADLFIPTPTLLLREAF